MFLCEILFEKRYHTDQGKTKVIVFLHQQWYIFIIIVKEYLYCDFLGNQTGEKSFMKSSINLYS